MQPDLTPITGRVAGLHAASVDDSSAEGLLAEINDALTEGYAWALHGDAWSIATEERLYDLMTEPGSSGELGSLAADHAVFQRQLMELRRSLSELWRDRDRLRGNPRAAA